MAQVMVIAHHCHAHGGATAVASAPTTSPSNDPGQSIFIVVSPD